jgi:hypothetical protein
VKKPIFAVAFVAMGLFSVCLFQGCKKDNLETVRSQNSADNSVLVQNRSINQDELAAINDVINENGTLKFKDQKHFLTVMQALEEGNQEYN